MLEQLISIIAPHHCISCTLEGSPLCKKCQHLLPSPTGSLELSPINRTYSSVIYAGYAKELLGALKFHRMKQAAAVMADVIADRMPQAMAAPALVSHVPTAPIRVRVRGYDQSVLLAKLLARRLSVPYAPLLGRTSTHRQLGKDRETRAQQMQHAFYMASCAKPNSVLLVDDVITTGSTMQQAAHILRRAGIGHVDAVSFARVP